MEALMQHKRAVAKKQRESVGGPDAAGSDAGDEDVEDPDVGYDYLYDSDVRQQTHQQTRIC